MKQKETPLESQQYKTNSEQKTNEQKQERNEKLINRGMFQKRKEPSLLQRAFGMCAP